MNENFYIVWYHDSQQRFVASVYSNVQRGGLAEDQKCVKS